MQHTIAACSLHHRVPPGRKCRLSASRFHIVLRELDALLSTQQRRQDEHPLVRSHAGVRPRCQANGPCSIRTWSPGLSLSRCGSSIRPLRSRLRRLRKLDQTVALVLTQVIDDLISDARRPDTVHDQADGTDAPAGGVPLRLGSRRATAQYDIGKPTRTVCAIGGATAKLRRFGLVWDSSGPPQVTLRGTFFWR